MLFRGLPNILPLDNATDPADDQGIGPVQVFWIHKLTHVGLLSETISGVCGNCRGSVIEGSKKSTHVLYTVSLSEPEGPVWSLQFQIATFKLAGTAKPSSLKPLYTFGSIS